MHKLNLKLKIFIYFTIAAILPSMLFWVLIYAKVDSELEKDYRSMTQTSVQNHIKEIDQFLEKQAYVVNSIANAYPYIDNSDSSILEFLHRQEKTNRDLQNLYIVDNNGRAYVNTGNILDDVNYSAFTPYKNATRKQGLVWLRAYNDRISGLRAIGIAAPVYNRDGQQEGVLVANLPYDFFHKTLAGKHLAESTNIYLIGASGEVKFSTSSKSGMYENIRSEGFILQQVADSIMSTERDTYDFSYDGNKWMCTFSTEENMGWKIVVLYHADDIVKNVSLLNKDLYSFITVFGAAVLTLVLFLSVFLSNSISEPLIELRDGAQQLFLGDLDQTITVKGMQEIKVVADTFNQMSYNLKKSYKDLFSRTEELYEKNEYLQEINAELAASYEQLGATMEQLNESEDKYRRLVNNISDLVVVINSEGQIVYVNSSVERITGYSEAQLIGRPIKAVLHGMLNESNLENSFNNDYNEFQLQMIKADGELLYMEGSTRRLIENGSVVGVQAIARDITQRKLMEDELNTRYKELQAINEVTNAVTRTLDLNEMLDVVVEQVMNAANALCCIVGLYDEADEFELKAVRGIKLEDKSTVNVDATKNKTRSLVGKRPYYILEHKSDEALPSEYFKLLYREEDFRFTLFIPLTAHGRQIGMMSTLLRFKPTQEMIELVISMGNSIALSVDNARAYENVKTSYLKTVQSLVSTIEAKDMYTESHSVRVAKYATFIAKELNLSKNEIEDIWVAGVLHDIGKIGISDSILNKKDKLTDEEYRIIKEHPGIAYKILSNIGLDQKIMTAVRHHHERYDGKGYPDGLHGENINYMASIISVADAFDAITSQRSYKEPKSLQEGIQELIACKGTQFNPQVVEVFSRSYDEKRDVFNIIHNDGVIELF